MQHGNNSTITRCKSAGDLLSLVNGCGGGSFPLLKFGNELRKREESALEREEQKKHSRLELEAIPSPSSKSSVCSFVSARSESADFYQIPLSNSQSCPSTTGKRPFLLDFSPKRVQPSLPPKSRLSTTSTSISTLQKLRHNSQQQQNLLTIPRFRISPPTPTPSASAISVLSQRSLKQLYKSHRGELTPNEQYKYYLSRAQLKASSRTSALLSGFAMIALVELIYQKTTPRFLLISLAVVTTLLVCVHLLTLLMSTCLLPYIEAHGCTKDSPHIKLKFYVDLSWLFSTFIGLILFLIEIVLIFFVKFESIGFDCAAWITTAILVPVLIFFVIVSLLIRRTVNSHFVERMNAKAEDELTVAAVIRRHYPHQEVGTTLSIDRTSMRTSTLMAGLCNGKMPPHNQQQHSIVTNGHMYR